MCARLVVVNFRGRAFRDSKRCGAHCVFKLCASANNHMIFFINPLSRGAFFADLTRVAF